MILAIVLTAALQGAIVVNHAVNKLVKDLTMGRITGGK